MQPHIQGRASWRVGIGLFMLGLVLLVAPAQAADTVVLYGVSDVGQSDSQFFRILGTTSVEALGPVHIDHDIEAIDIHPHTGVLYAIAGGGGDKDGNLYQVDKLTGALSLIGNTGTGGLNEIVAASFTPSGVLWAFQENVGLVTVDLDTAAISLEWAVTGDGIGHNWEGLAWDAAGLHLYGAEGGTLYRWDPFTEVADVLCADGLTDPTEALDFRPDGVLMGGSHRSATPSGFRIYSINFSLCEAGPAGYDIPFIDIESMAFEVIPGPPGACRITGGGISPDGGVDPGSEAALLKATFGGQVGASFGRIGCFDTFDDIRGNWTHMRHPRAGSFHARDYNSLVCGCDGVFDGELCNPDDRELGPLPRPAPANMACWTGVGDYTPRNGNRSIRVAFRVNVEDRGEPGAGSNAGNLDDVYRIRIWIPKGKETANGLADAVCCTRGEPSSVRAPDVDDGGNLVHGNLQIHPQLPNSTRP